MGRKSTDEGIIGREERRSGLRHRADSFGPRSCVWGGGAEYLENTKISGKGKEKMAEDEQSILIGDKSKEKNAGEPWAKTRIEAQILTSHR